MNLTSFFTNKMASTVQDSVKLTFIIIFYLALMPQTLTQQVETNPEILVVKSLKSLGAAIQYFTNREANVDTNELLGLRVVAESLFSTIENCMESAKVSVPQVLLEEMKLLCAKLNVLIPRILNIHKSVSKKGYKRFIASRFKGFRSYRPIQVDKEERPTLKILEAVELEDFQACLGDLSLKNASTCIINQQCWKVLEPKISQGQNISYQAMVLVMVELLGCSYQINQKWNSITIEDLADHICYSLYPKVSSFHASDILQDPEEVGIFLDAFFACSLLGFQDFLQVLHMRIPAVVQWQLPDGCFGLKNTETDKGVTGTCLPRMSSAAIGQLGLYLRWLLDPTGYTALTGTQPFPSPSWFIPLVIILFVIISASFGIRRVRRFLLGLLWRFYDLLTFTKK